MNLIKRFSKLKSATAVYPFRNTDNNILYDTKRTNSRTIHSTEKNCQEHYEKQSDTCTTQDHDGVYQRRNYLSRSKDEVHALRQDIAKIKKEEADESYTHTCKSNANFFQPLQRITSNCYSLDAEVLQIHSSNFLIGSQLNIPDI